MSGTEETRDELESELEVAEGAEPEIEQVDEDETPGLELVDPDPLEQASAELEASQARLRTVSKAYKDLQAEMSAFKARLERQQALKEEILKGDVVSALFEPLENLTRTIDAMQRAGVDEATLEGLSLVRKNFLDGFAKLGLEEIGAEGRPFDPSVHEALTTMPVTDEALDDTIVQVFAQGYRVGTRVIRPARVVVGRYTEPAGEA
jgi:molecular chaperone GrpE